MQLVGDVGMNEDLYNVGVESMARKARKELYSRETCAVADKKLRTHK